MKIMNPTGGGLRSDSAGHGAYGANRGTRKHSGKDYLAEPGQAVLAPIDGRIERIAKPYANDVYSGLVITGKDASVKMFYFKPTVEPGAQVNQGDKIGLAQDISKKHGGGMRPHVHLEFVSVNPELFEV